MKIVKFTKPLDQYRVDDAGSFEDKIAERVIAAGYGLEIQLEDTSLSKSKK